MTAAGHKKKKKTAAYLNNGFLRISIPGQLARLAVRRAQSPKASGIIQRRIKGTFPYVGQAIEADFNLALL
jgi:hypothetical protein